jgi:uncharacterized membrane protein YdjX (TVP38/TMEM64 family)
MVIPKSVPSVQGLLCSVAELVIPFSNSTVMSLLCGSGKVQITPFMVGSLIGFVPLAAVFATYGSGGMKGNMLQIGFATMLLVPSFF